MQCYRPVRLVKRLDDAEFASEFFVPCGKCYACLQNRQTDWVNRMKAEQEHSKSSYFVTITYDDDHLPTKLFYNGDCFKHYVQSLDKPEVQKFMKRLRKSLYCKARFFLAGEYGSTTIRPHYHLCLFLDDYVDLTQLDDILSHTWQLGFHQIAELKEQRMAYCVKYLVKGGKYPEHAQKPFCLMSRRPGIGEQYISRETYDYHLGHPYLVQVGGFKQRLPGIGRIKCVSTMKWSCQIVWNWNIVKIMIGIRLSSVNGAKHALNIWNSVSRKS